MADTVQRVLGRPVHTVPHGVDHDRFRPAATPGTEILYVGDAYGHKRDDVALAAWAALPEPRPVLRLIPDLRVEPRTGERLREVVERHRALGPIVLTRQLSEAELDAPYEPRRAAVDHA